MRRPLLVALAAALAGCVPQDPDDVFYFLGRVTDLAAAPRGGAAVSLWRSGAHFCSGTERPILRIGEGEASLAPPYDRLRDAAANEDGRFFFDLMRFEIKATDQDQRCFAMVAGGAGGARTRSVIFGDEKDVDFPDLVVWDGVALSEELSPARVSLPALPWAPNAGEPPDPLASSRRVAYDWLLTQGGGELIWHEITSAEPLLLRPELLEDFPAPAASLQAWINETVVRQTGPFATPDATLFLTTVQTPARPLSATGVVPASRGAACTVNGSALAGCPLTDGSMGLALLPSHLLEQPPPSPFQPDEIVLELARPIVPRLLVVRDLHGPGRASLLIEASADGTSWIQRSPEPVFEHAALAGIPEMASFLGTGEHFAASLDFGGQAITRLRITAQDGTYVLAARELSVFE